MSSNTVITKKARENMVKARAGAIHLPQIVGMAFGDGGTDLAGVVLIPDENQAELNHELYRKEIDGYTFLSDVSCRYKCTLTEEELANTYLSELGLYDSNGDIVCIKNFTKKGKDNDFEMTFSIDDIF